MSSLSFSILLILTVWPLALSLQNSARRSDWQADVSPTDEDQPEEKLVANPDFELIALDDDLDFEGHPAHHAKHDGHARGAGHAVQGHRGNTAHHHDGAALHTATESGKHAHAVRAARRASKNNRTVVWVSGYARSGTSTVLSMVEAAGEKPPSLMGVADGEASKDVFALFEPCKTQGQHHDVYDPWLAKAGCAEVLRKIATCDFNGIKHLRGWNNSHSTKPGLTLNEDYTESKAETSCGKASLVAFKTINLHLGGKEAKKLFALSKFFVIDIVRDPRGVYASYKKTFGGSTDVSHLYEICEYMAGNQEVSHHGIVRLVFEDFVRSPQKVMTAAFKTMGLNFGGPQWQWVQDNFDAKECEPSNDDRYADCHTDSEASIMAWRKELSNTELAAFRSHKACAKIMNKFNYPMY